MFPRAVTKKKLVNFLGRHIGDNLEGIMAIITVRNNGQSMFNPCEMCTIHAQSMRTPCAMHAHSMYSQCAEYLYALSLLMGLGWLTRYSSDRSPCC